MTHKLNFQVGIPVPHAWELLPTPHPQVYKGFRLENVVPRRVENTAKIFEPSFPKPFSC